MKMTLNALLSHEKWHTNSNVLMMGVKLDWMKLQDDAELKVMGPIQVVLSNFYSACASIWGKVYVQLCRFYKDLNEN